MSFAVPVLLVVVPPALVLLVLRTPERPFRAVFVCAAALARQRRTGEARLGGFACAHERESMMQRVEVCDVRRGWATAVARAAALLRAGHVVAYPTDTLYALGAAASEARGVQALLAIKERPAHKPLPIIAADLEQVTAHVGPLPPLATRLARRFWPGPLTLVMPATHLLAAGVAAADGSVAVRVPASDLARALAGAVEQPLTATSANVASEPPAMSAEQVIHAFGATLALVLDGGPARAVTPSTIVDIRGSVPRLLREGAVPWRHVLESLE